MWKERKNVKKKKTDSIRILTDEEIAKNLNINKILKCNECNCLPQIIEKSQQSEYYTEKRYKFYCPKCQRGTGFSWNIFNMFKNWNKMVSPVIFENCHIYSFYPSEENGIPILKDYSLKFRTEQYEIIHNKGGERYLYYAFGDKERKLDLEKFVENVAIYEEFFMETPYGFLGTGIKVCVVIAEDECEAKNKLNRRLKFYFDNVRKELFDSLKHYEERCRKEKQKIENFDEYIKNIKS